LLIIAKAKSMHGEEPMSEIHLLGCDATNPLGALAGLGAFRSTAIRWPKVRLKWACDEMVPHPILVFDDDVDTEELLNELTDQRARWMDSALLNNTYPDVKEVDLQQWSTSIRTDQSGLPVDELFVALVAEGALDLKKNNKPSHLHFTAGQQQFLDIVREVGEASTKERLTEALYGPWRFDSSAKTLRWDPRGERIYALRGFNPSADKSFGVPGADWLGFIGLTFFPTTNRRGTLLTTACNRDWKVSAFRWPCWGTALGLASVKALMVSELLAEDHRGDLRPNQLGAAGVHSIFKSPIRRSDQGGYGSFGPSTAIVSTAY
jgi:hypothetical protein